MKKVKSAILVCIFAILCGCSIPASTTQASDAESSVTVTDCASKLVEVKKSPQSVFALSSSFAEIWLLAGGELSGVTDDALSERGLNLPEDVQVLGTVKDPNVELILSEQPDFVILSQDIASHTEISETLDKAGIPHYMAKVETLEDYLKALGDFVSITGDESMFYENGELVKKEVDSLLAKLPEESPNTRKKALFMRAFSTDVKVKARDHTVCYILEDIGVENIAAREGFPLEELSVEAILEADPDYIFVVAMGDEEAAKAFLDKMLAENPAWNSLSAVQNDNMIMLAKNHYHYKPNRRWGEAYETLLKIIHPEIYAGE